MARVKSGTVAWGGLSIYVLFWDYYALRKETETLTSAFGRAINHPIARWPTTFVWLTTTLHLFHILPSRIDPFGLLSSIIVGKNRAIQS